MRMPMPARPALYRWRRYGKKLSRAAREVETYNLDRRPLVMLACFTICRTAVPLASRAAWTGRNDSSGLNDGPGPEILL